MNEITLWQWQVKEPSGRWRTLRWRMTEDQARDWSAREGREMRCVQNSAEVRDPIAGAGGMMEKLGTRK